MDTLEFGKYVRKRRKAMNMTQAELAAKLNISDKAVSKWEMGKSFPDITILEQLAEELGITLSQLIMCDEEVKGLPCDNDALVKSAIELSKREMEYKKSRMFRRLAASLGGILVAMLILVGAYLKFAPRTRTRNLDVKIVEVTEDYYKVRTSPSTVDKTGMDFYLSLSDDWYKAFPIEGEVGDRYLITYQGKENMKDGMYLHNILSVKKMEE